MQENAPVRDLHHRFAGASVRMARHVRGPSETGIAVFAMTKKDGETFFEAHYDFAANGNDFWVRIVNFGIADPSVAGSISSIFQEEFSSEEIDAARRCIEVYFSGSEVKDTFPFVIAKARFLGVKYGSDWANVQKRPET